MNFQSPQMLIIFGSIFAVSMISLVVLLLIRSKKMKSAGAQPDNQTVSTLNQQTASIGMTAAASAATPSPTISQPDPIVNSMQLTSNPFEVNAIDLNSQNLGGNLEAKGGMPNEGIMQNPNTAPNMEIASPVLSAEPMNPPVNTPAPVNDIPAMNPSLDFGSAATATPVAAQPVTPNTIPTIEPVVTPVQPEPQIPVVNSNPIITPSMPTPVETSINVNAINSSGLDTSAQPTNPMTSTPQDPAGIFSQPPQAQAEPVQTAVPQAIAAEDMEVKISDLPKVSEPENVQGNPIATQATPITANTVADLTPTTNIAQPTQPIATPVSSTEIKLPDIAEINTVSNVPEPQIPQETVIEMQMPVVGSNQANTVNAVPQNTIPTIQADAGLPPLPNMVNTPQPIATTTASVNPAPTNPVITQTATIPTQPLATNIPSPMPATQQPIATSVNGLPPLK